MYVFLSVLYIMAIIVAVCLIIAGPILAGVIYDNDRGWGKPPRKVRRNSALKALGFCVVSGVLFLSLSITGIVANEAQYDKKYCEAIEGEWERWDFAGWSCTQNKEIESDKRFAIVHEEPSDES